VADADDGSFVVRDVSLHLVRGCLPFSCPDGTLLDSSLSESNPSFFLEDALDDIIQSSLNGVRSSVFEG
jgi:hypothetical protein